MEVDKEEGLKRKGENMDAMTSSKKSTVDSSCSNGENVERETNLFFHDLPVEAAANQAVREELRALKDRVNPRYLWVSLRSGKDSSSETTENKLMKELGLEPFVFKV